MMQIRLSQIQMILMPMGEEQQVEGGDRAQKSKTTGTAHGLTTGQKFSNKKHNKLGELPVVATAAPLRCLSPAQERNNEIELRRKEA